MTTTIKIQTKMTMMTIDFSDHSDLTIESVPQVVEPPDAFLFCSKPTFSTGECSVPAEEG